jgi:hypothetical protein
LLGLPNKHRLRFIDHTPDSCLHVFRLMSYDYVDLLRGERRRSPAHVLDQRPSIHLVKHLCQARPHSSSKPGSKDQNVESGLFRRDLFHPLNLTAGQ